MNFSLKKSINDFIFAYYLVWEEKKKYCIGIHAVINVTLYYILYIYIFFIPLSIWMLWYKYIFSFSERKKEKRKLNVRSYYYYYQMKKASIYNTLSLFLFTPANISFFPLRFYSSCFFRKKFLLYTWHYILYFYIFLVIFTPSIAIIFCSC